MNPARIVVLTVAVGAGGVAAYLASSAGPQPAAAAAPVAQLQTIEVLVAKNDIPLGQVVTPGDLEWQTWHAASASSNFIRRDTQPSATTDVGGSIAHAPFIAGEPIRKQKLVKADGSGFVPAILPAGVRATLEPGAAGARPGGTLAPHLADARQTASNDITEAKRASVKVTRYEITTQASLQR
ncbi:Flp pilus assembly protein CpaB [Rhodopseudomonas sp. P1]|uniref:Flp pilus assembly protein CpaB n=1 Tax=Rhodopseudomonas sp. P1 TaxID=3434357 RepID=UPI0031FE27E1